MIAPARLPRGLSLKIGAGWLGAWYLGAFAVVGGYGLHAIPYSLESALVPGRDAFGRSVWALTLHASLLSSGIALSATIASLALGIGIGAWIALQRGIWLAVGDSTLRLALSFPALLVALGIAAVRGPGWGTLALALAAGSVPGMARLARLRAREVLAEEYVHAARALGASDWHILRRHLIPAFSSLAAIKGPALFAHALIAEATLSFIGVGAPIGSDTWGSLLLQGKDYLLEAPWIALATGTPLLFTALSLITLADSFTARRDLRL